MAITSGLLFWLLWSTKMHFADILLEVNPEFFAFDHF